MRYILVVLSVLFCMQVTAQGTYTPDATKKRFSQGIIAFGGIGDTANFKTAVDSNVLIYQRSNGKLYFRKGTTYYAELPTSSTPTAYLLISDTATMLSPLLRKSDTATMLINYARNGQVAKLGSSNTFTGTNTFSNDIGGSKWTIYDATGRIVLDNGAISSNGSGTFSATNISGTLSTPSQPNITSVGTLALLTVSGTITAGSLSSTNTIKGNINGNANSVTNGIYTTTVAAGELAGTYPNPTILNSAVISKVLTGFSAAAGTVTSSDNILQAIQKLAGNISSIVSGVSSFNGRTGAVVPTIGDYATLTETLQNKTISGANNTLSNIGNGSLTYSSITINTTGSISGGGSVALGQSITITGTSSGAGITITGTPNQIVPSAPNGNVALSIPSALIVSSSISSTNLYGTVGTLSSLNVAGGAVIGASGTNATAVIFKAQPNLASQYAWKGYSYYCDCIVSSLDGSGLLTVSALSVTGTAEMASLSVNGSILASGLSLTGVVHTSDTATLLSGLQRSGNMVTVASQTNITLLGTLTALTVSGTEAVNNLSVTTNETVGGNLTVTGGISAGSFVGNGSHLTNIPNTALPNNGNITINTSGSISGGGSVAPGGSITLTGGGSGGSITMIGTNGLSFTPSSGNNFTGSLGDITPSSVNSSGTITGTTLAGTITTPSQPNITSVGTLNNLTATGNISANALSVTGYIITSGLHIPGYNFSNDVLPTAAGNTLSVTSAATNYSVVVRNAFGNTGINNLAAGSINVSGTETVGSTLTVTGTTVTNHLAGKTATPTITVNSAVTSHFPSATYAVSGSDVAGKISIHLSGSDYVGVANGVKFVTITFATPYPVAPFVSLTSASTDLIAIATNQSVDDAYSPVISAFFVKTTTTGFELWFNDMTQYTTIIGNSVFSGTNDINFHFHVIANQ